MYYHLFMHLPINRHFRNFANFFSDIDHVAKNILVHGSLSKINMRFFRSIPKSRIIRLSDVHNFQQISLHCLFVNPLL